MFMIYRREASPGFYSNMLSNQEFHTDRWGAWSWQCWLVHVWGDHDHDNGDNHDYCWSYVWEGGLLCEENKFWHLHYHLHVSGEILQVKFWQNILWILIIAAQESETRPLDFTETMQRPALTSVSVNLNRGGSKGFDNREGAEGALTYVSPTLNIVFLQLVIMCRKRDGRECKRTYIYLTHQSLNEWMPARN